MLPIVRETCRGLLTGAGIATLDAAQILMSWSHAGRCRDHAALADTAVMSVISAQLK
ncbi:hypothetical protein [Microbacterium binotii]|uniref:Uncharacterized protein n=1 Tax=Microbacterium binotii TaxID=462710 RepID=A0ABN3PI46_9MICO